MSTRWRIIDTGLRSAAENMALNRAILEAHQQGHIPNTLRFLQFRPAALVGYHQSVAQELQEDYCRAQGVEIQRRVTGGGAIYFDPGQLGWELYFNKRDLGRAEMAGISAAICEAAAAGLSKLGIAAQFRPRNDIEVEGRKISGTGGVFDGDSVLFQGTVLVDFDIEAMLRVLRVPAEKLSAHAIASARERVTCLRTLLGTAPDLAAVKDALRQGFGEGLGLHFGQAGLSEAEEALFAQALREIDDPEWVYLVDRPRQELPTLSVAYKAPGGLIRVEALVDDYKGRLAQVLFTGDFFVNPKRLIADLEAHLRNVRLDEVPGRIREFFASREADMMLLTPDDFIHAFALLLEHREQVARQVGQ
ncbi:MAG: lipoyl protein ligase domain-containing protein [Pseudomonadota bacterium]